MNNFNLCTIDILNSELADDLIQTLINIVSAHEKIEELVKYKHLILSAASPLEKKVKNVEKIKNLLAGIQKGKQMLFTKAKSVYSFENLDDFALNLTHNCKTSLENLITTSITNLKKPPSLHNVLSNSQFGNKNNKISSYLNIVTTNNLHQQEGNTNCNANSNFKKNKNNNINDNIDFNPFDSHSIKCVSTYISSNSNTEEVYKKTSIVPKKITSEFAEFDICYPPTKIDIFYPRAKINICSDVPQIDLNLQDPLIEYKSYCFKNIKERDDSKKSSKDASDSITVNSSVGVKANATPTQSCKGPLQCEYYDPKSLNKFATSSNTASQSNSLRHATSVAEIKNNIKTNASSEMSSSSTNETTSSKLNKNYEMETENFIQAMISSDCGGLLHELLHKYMLLDKSCKKGEIKVNSKILEYNEWLKRNYSVNDLEASRIQKYIETWYINCMLEKLSLES